MKYKVGDRVYMKGTVIEVDERDEMLETLVDFEMNGKEWTNPKGLSPYCPSEKTYEEGLHDAWGLLRRLVANTNPSKLIDIGEFFGVSGIVDILDKYTPQEAFAKLKAYEEAQKIKVGDVVKNEDGYEYVVTNIYKDRDSCRYNGVTSEGKWTGCYEPIKTGKHIDIAGLLEQIRGE